MRRWLDFDLLDPHSYGRIAYLLLALPLGIAEFTFLVTALSTGLGLAITLIGILILIATIYAWRFLARLERRLIAALTGRVIADPYRPAPDGSRWKRLGARLADPATWKDLVFLLLQLPLGIVSFVVAITVLATGLAGLTAPLWFWAVPGGIETGVLAADTLPEALLTALVGAMILGLGLPALSALGRLYGAYAELLLGSNADPVLAAEMTDLRDARSRIIEAADAERRRIERDLHDGAQQRLVALALNLRVAEKRAQDGNPEAAELVRRAGEEANLALKELRDLARGIHPAILTNRGLPAALDDLAGRAAVPVEVMATPDERLPGAVEAAVYFVVSECLANMGKHAAASSGTVAVSVRDARVDVLVSDDGVGGADTSTGSGLQGLADRVGALDGRVSVQSPSGAGTRVEASIPLVGGTPAGAAAKPAPVALSDAEAAARREARLRGMRLRVGGLATVAGVILAIWALTGAPNAWPVWPLLGLGLIGGLDAWFAWSYDPQRKHHRLRTSAGALTILNLFLIGIWIASGASYFWPAWVLLGSGIGLALKALPWHDAVRERYAA